MSSTYTEQPNFIFNQGLFEQSSTQKHRIGTIRELADGRKYAYAKAGATLVSGQVNQAAVPDTYAPNCAIQAVASIGDKHIHITYGAGARATANYFRDGYLAITMPAYGVGLMYKIRGHVAMTSGLAVQVDLYDTVLEALAVTSKCTLTKHPQDSVIQGVITSHTGVTTGVNPIDVADTYYFWNQVKGVCNCLCNGTWVVSDALTPGGVAGAIMPWATTSQPIVAHAMVVPTDTYGGLCQLCIPGY
jgi:hypothetical protein